MARADVKARYAAKLLDIIERGDRLNDQELRALFRLIDDARKEAKRLILDNPTDWQLTHFDVLRQRLEGLMVEVGQDMSRQVRELDFRRWEDGRTVTDELLDRFGGERELLGVPMDPTKLQVLSRFGAELVTNVSDEVINDISTKLQLGIAGDKTPWEVMQDIGPTLVDADGNPAPGVWGDVITRAEAIYRTESNRVFSVAQEQRLGQWNKQRPGLKKTWKHGGSAVKQPRPAHVRAGRDYSPGGNPGPIPVSKSFIVGGEEMRYPRDPAASAKNTVFCHCTSGPWRDHWAEQERAA